MRGDPVRDAASLWLRSVLDGRHVIGREFEYINMNPWNRVAFCRAALDTYPSSALRGKGVWVGVPAHSHYGVLL